MGARRGLTGEWKGIARLTTRGFGTLPTRQFLFVFKLEESPDGALSGWADGPDIGVVQMPLEDLRLDGDELSCGIRAMGARFWARLRDPGPELGGRLEFGRAQVPLVLRRDDSALRVYELPRIDARGEPQLEYAYRPPEESDDGWKTATLADAGVSEAPLHDLVATILAGEFPRQESLLLVRNGTLVLEEYFRGQRRDQTHTFQSVTKSVTSMGVGLAVDRGLVDVEAPVHTFFSERTDTRWVREAYPVSVRHALTMSAALDWNEELPYVDPHNDNRAMNASGDWIGYVLDRELAGRPGEAYRYCSGLTLLLGAIVRSATGRSIDDWVAEHLFEPLGIEHFGWGAAADGTRHTGGGLHLRPRDMAKLGQVILDGGCWHGRRVLSEMWVRESTSPHLSAGLPFEPDPPLRSCRYGDLRYGYQWWLPTYELGERRVEAIEGLGYGGQCLCIVPALDLVVVLNAGDYEGERGRVIRLLGEHILPAVS